MACLCLLARTESVLVRYEAAQNIRDILTFATATVSLTILVGLNRLLDSCRLSVGFYQRQLLVWTCVFACPARSRHSHCAPVIRLRLIYLRWFCVFYCALLKHKYLSLFESIPSECGRNICKVSVLIIELWHQSFLLWPFDASSCNVLCSIVKNQQWVPEGPYKPSVVVISLVVLGCASFVSDRREVCYPQVQPKCVNCFWLQPFFPILIPVWYFVKPDNSTFTKTLALSFVSSYHYHIVVFPPCLRVVNILHRYLLRAIDRHYNYHLKCRFYKNFN